MGYKFLNTCFILLILHLLTIKLTETTIKTARYRQVNENGYCFQNTTAKDLPIEDLILSFPVCNTTIDKVITLEQHEWLNSLGKKARSPKAFPTIRKEIRMLNDLERKKFFRALLAMKNSYIGDLSEYDIFAEIHRPNAGPAGTRAGPGSLPWHRESELRIEAALKTHDPDVALPFWDDRLDIYLENPYQSAIFSTELLGSMCEVNGILKNWTVGPSCAKKFGSKKIRRSCLAHPNVTAMTDWETLYLLDRPTFSDLSQRLCIVADHDSLHYFLGGSSAFSPEKTCAVADPAVWLFHTHMDHIWEEFRQLKQTEQQRINDYPSTGITKCHEKSFDLAPYDGLTVGDALDTSYTRNNFIYESAPRSCTKNEHCISKYLRCETNLERCVSKTISEL